MYLNYLIDKEEFKLVVLKENQYCYFDVMSVFLTEKKTLLHLNLLV